jgi:hypothetical protein
LWPDDKPSIGADDGTPPTTAHWTSPNDSAGRSFRGCVFAVRAETCQLSRVPTAAAGSRPGSIGISSQQPVVGAEQFEVHSRERNSCGCQLCAYRLQEPGPAAQVDICLRRQVERGDGEGAGPAVAGWLFVPQLEVGVSPT